MERRGNAGWSPTVCWVSLDVLSRSLIRHPQVCPPSARVRPATCSATGCSMAIVGCLPNCLTGSSLWGSVCFVVITFVSFIDRHMRRTYRLQCVCVGQTEGCLAEQQGGTPCGCIALRSETADRWQGNNIYVDVCQFFSNMLREWRCRDGANRRLRLSSLEHKKKKKGEKLREEAPWGGALCSRIGIWNFPQDDGDG